MNKIGPLSLTVVFVKLVRGAGDVCLPVYRKTNNSVLMLRGDDKSIREMSPLGGDDRTESCMFWPTEQN